MLKFSRFAAVLANLFIITLLTHSPIAISDEFDDLIGSERSTNFTTSERALFIDAPNRFKKYIIPEAVSGTEPFWIDNERLAFSSRKYGQWEAKSDEPSRIISFNVLTGEIVDSGYRGILRCLNHLGDVLIHQMDVEFGSYSEPAKYRWFSGKWGSPLKRIDYASGTQTPTYLCQFVPNGPFIFGMPLDKIPSDAAKLTPLLPEHGFIKETISIKNGEIREPVYLVKPDGKTTWLQDKRLNYFHFVYQPWSKSYFEGGPSSIPPKTIYPSGERTIHLAPRIIRFWEKTRSASASAFSSRAGVIWAVKQGYRYWKKQGLYLQRDNEIIRIEAGEGNSNFHTSENGCMVFVGVTRGDPFELSVKSESIIIDVCSENKK